MISKEIKGLFVEDELLPILAAFYEEGNLAEYFKNDFDTFLKICSYREEPLTNFQGYLRAAANDKDIEKVLFCIFKVEENKDTKALWYERFAREAMHVKVRACTFSDPRALELICQKYWDKLLTKYYFQTAVFDFNINMAMWIRERYDGFVDPIECVDPELFSKLCEQKDTTEEHFEMCKWLYSFGNIRFKIRYKKSLIKMLVRNGNFRLATYLFHQTPAFHPLRKFAFIDACRNIRREGSLDFLRFLYDPSFGIKNISVGDVVNSEEHGRKISIAIFKSTISVIPVVNFLRSTGMVVHYNI